MELTVEQANAMMTPRFPGVVGIEFTEVAPGLSVCRARVRDRLLNPARVLHGGVHYTLADTGMAIALLPLLDEGSLFTTVEIKISYFKAVTEGDVTCATRVVRKGNRIIFLESDIRDNDQIVAKASGTYYVSPKR